MESSDDVFGSTEYEDPESVGVGERGPEVVWERKAWKMTMQDIDDKAGMAMLAVKVRNWDLGQIQKHNKSIDCFIILIHL